MRSLVLLALAGCAGSRAEEAFALGQLGMAWDPVPETQRAAAEAKLVRRLSSEPDPEVRDRMVEALGKLGGDSAVQALSGQLSGAQRARAAVALGLLFKNGKLKEPMTGLGALIEDSDDEVRYSAAYALFRMKQPLDRCLNDRSWLVRATCARSAIDPRALAEKLGDPDERVAAEAGRSLAKLAVKCASDQPCAALEALAASGNWRPQVAAAIAFEPVTHPAAVGLFSSRAGNDCQLALAHDRALGRVDLLDRCHGDERRRAVLAARALGEGHGEVAQLLPLAAHHEAAVRAAAAEALGKLALPAADEALRRLLGDRDLTVLAATAEAVAERRVAGTEAALLLRLAPLGGPDAIEAIQGLCHALAALGARSAIPELQRRTRDPHAALRSAARAALKELGQPLLPELPSVSPRIRPPTFARVQLETTRGTVILRLGHAPRTVDNFLKLVAARFYDGLLFHRVVPNFVAQGGDPRGDGSGGPGWTIPCEINPTRYREGTVGMALSGRDTGGSQFFIALSPQPHLDGRYTVFGEVESGFPAVRALEEGDRILSARVLR